MHEFFIGGARSGKSRMAQQRAETIAGEQGKRLVYLATGQAGDAEMQARIAQHQQDRGFEWTLHEEPLQLAKALAAIAADDTCILLDCLTLWLSNCLHQDEKSQSDFWQSEYQKFLQLLPTLPGHIIIVSNEVGMGIVPMGELSRRFVDESGRLHQAVAALCPRVTYSVAGLPHVLKGA